VTPRVCREAEGPSGHESALALYEESLALTESLGASFRAAHEEAFEWGRQAAALAAARLMRPRAVDTEGLREYERRLKVRRREGRCTRLADCLKRERAWWGL
jgi:hypothetical protein